MMTHSRAPLAMVVLTLATTALCPLAFLAAQSPEPPPSDPAREEYLKINYLFNRELFELAIPEYQKLLEKHPEFAAAADVHYAIALCHYRIYLKKEQKGASLGADPALAEHLRGAVAHLETAVAAKTLASPAEAIRLLGQIHLLLGEHQRAADAFQRLLESAVDSAASGALAGLADARFLSGEFTAAADLYRKLLDRAGAEATAEVRRARYYLALSLYRGGEASGAAESAELFDAITADRESEFRDDALYMAALSRETRGELAGAEERYATALAGAGADTTLAALSRLGVARARFALERHEEAAATLEEFLATHPQHENREDAALLLARSLIELERYSEAGKILQDLRRSPRVGDETALHLAAVLARHGRHDAAAQTLRVAVSRFPQSPRLEELQIELVRQLIAGGELADAEETLRALVAESASSERLDELAYLQSWVLLQREKVEEAISVCNAFFERFAGSPRQGDVAQIYAEAQFLTGEHREAARAYREILAAAADAPPTDERTAAARRARFRIAQCHYLAGEYEDTLRLLTELGEVPDDEFFASRDYLAGEAAYQLQRFDHAVDALGSFVARHGEDARLAERVRDARFKRAHALQLAGRAAEAEAAYSAALAAPEAEAGAHGEQALFELGQIAYERKEHAAAVERFERLLADYPDSRFAPFALRFLGYLALERDDEAAALRHYGRLLDAHPEHELAADAQYQKATILRRSGRLEEARIELARFRERYPDSDLAREAQLQEGAALARTGDHAAALRVLVALREDLEDGVRDDEEPPAPPAPANAALRPRVLYEIAWCHRAAGDLAQASEAYAALVALESDAAEESARAVTATARLELAELEFERERYERALELLAPLADADGELGEKAVYRECWSHHRRGDGAATVAAFERFAARWKESALYGELAFLAAKALFDAGDAKRSAALFREVIATRPESPEAPLARLGLGECLLEERSFEDAQRELGAFLAANADSPFAHRAHFGLGWAHENLAAFDDAVREYRAVIAAVTTPLAARAQFQIGQCRVAEEKYREAVVELLQVTAKYTYPEWCAKALLQAAGCFEKLADRENARRYYTEVTSTYGERDEARLARERLRRLETD